MSAYSRMVVIPQEEYVQLSAMQQAKQPLANQLYRREQDYQENLHIKDPHRAVLLQSETVEQLKDLKNKMRESISLATPIASRARAIALFNSIEPHLNVNDRGEVITDDNDVISSSRYEDLINYATRRKRRQDYVPPGWEYFLTLLKKYNIPKFALNHETLREIDSGIAAIKPSKLPLLKKEIKKEFVSKLPLPKNWFKSSSSVKRGRTPDKPNPTAKRPKRERAPPKKFGEFAFY